jgi:hypothetical protein
MLQYFPDPRLLHASRTQDVDRVATPTAPGYGPHDAAPASKSAAALAASKVSAMHLAMTFHRPVPLSSC